MAHQFNFFNCHAVFLGANFLPNNRLVPPSSAQVVAHMFSIFSG